MTHNYTTRIFFSFLAAHGIHATMPLFTETEFKNFWEHDQEFVQSFNRLTAISLFRMQATPSQEIPQVQLNLTYKVMKHLFITESKVPAYVRNAIKAEQKAEVIDKRKLFNKKVTLLPLHIVLQHFLGKINSDGSFSPYETSSSDKALQLSYANIHQQGWNPEHIKALDHVMLHNIERNRTLRSLLEHKNFKMYFSKLMGSAYTASLGTTGQEKHLIFVDEVERRTLDSIMTFSIELELPLTEIEITFPSDKDTKQGNFQVSALGTIVGLSATMVASAKWFRQDRKIKKRGDDDPDNKQEKKDIK